MQAQVLLAKPNQHYIVQAPPAHISIIIINSKQVLAAQAQLCLALLQISATLVQNISTLIVNNARNRVSVGSVARRRSRLAQLP